MKRLLVVIVVFSLSFAAAPCMAADGTWNADISTNWGSGPWIGAVPNGIDSVAAFTNNITANRTVTNEATRSVGAILFGDTTGGSAFTILGSGLTMDSSAGPALIGQYYGGASNFISVGSLTLNSDLVVTSSAVGGWVMFATPISGSGRTITFSGSGAQDVGQFAMLNNNTYSGGTTVRWSRVSVQQNNALGTGLVVIEPTGQVWLANNIVLTNAVVMSGPGWKEATGNLGAFRLSGGSRVAGPVTMSGDSRLTVWGATEFAEVSGAITGPFTLDKTGSGTLYLTGDNSYEGTLISGGTVQVGRATSTGSLGYGATTNNAVLQFYRTTDLTVSNNIIGTGVTRQLNGSATVALLGSNSFGGLLVGSGSRDGAFVLAPGSTNLVTGDAVVGATSSMGVGSFGRMVISSGSTLRVNGQFMLGNASGSTGDVAQLGGDVSVGAALRIGHYPLNYSTYTMDGGTLRTTANVGANPFGVGEQNGVIYLGIDGAGAFRQNGGDVITAAIVLDNRGMTAGNDLYTLAGGNLFIGQWGVQGNQDTRFDAGGGSIIASNNLAINVPFHLTNITGATKISVPAAGFVTLSNAYGMGSAIITNGTVVLADVGARKVLAGDLTLIGGGEIRHTGSGMTLLAGDNSIGGLVVSNGTLGYALERSAGGASSPITVAGGFLQVDGTTVRQIETHAVNWSSFSGGIDVASPFNTIVITTNIDGTGSFTKAGAGTIVMTSADHTYSGGTIVSNGTLRLVGGNDPLDVAGEVRVVRGTLDLGGASQEVQGGVSLHGGAVVNGTINNTGAFGFDVQGGLVGVDLDGNVGITKTTGGTATLVGDNGFTGDVQMNGGVLQVVRDANLGAGGDLNFAGGRLAIAGSAISNFNGRGVNWGTFNGGLDIVSTNFVFTLNNVISGAGSFTKGGAGTLLMNVANTYSGSTIVSNGTLVLAADQSTTGGAMIGAGSATLQVGTGGAAGWMGSGPVTNNGTLRFLRSDVVVVANTILGGGAVRQAGSGTLIITNALTAGQFFSQQGTVVITNGGIVQATGWASVGQAAGDNGRLIVNGSGIMRSTGDLNIGDATGSRGLLLLQDSGVVTSRSFYVGRSGTAVGVYIQSNGTLRVGSGSDIRVGGGGGSGDKNAYGYVRQTGGEIHFGANYQMGAYGIGVHDMTGGILSNRSWITPGRWAGGYGQLNFLGGTAYVHNTGAGIIVGETGTSDMNIENANVLINGRLRIGGGTTGTGIVNLASGGLMVTPWVEKTGGEGFLNFHGGTLRLTANSATSLQGLNRATVWSEGGTLEITNGIVASVRQNIDAPLGNGVTSIAVNNGGSGYVGTPYVRISGGGGTGATAIAEVDFVTGTITNFRITNPGHGYVTPPTIALYGGGASSAAYAGTVSIAAQTGGALVKTGAGMLSLVGTNTYSGGTIINGGLLAFGEPGPVTTNMTNGVFATPGSPSLPMTGDITINAGGGLVASGVYANANAWLASGRIASNSAGTLALTPTSTVENIDLSAIAGGSYTGLYVGAAQGSSILYRGTLTPSVDNNYRLGGGGGVLILNNELALTGAGELRAGNHTGSNTVVWVGGSNTYAGGTTVDGAILSFAGTNNLGTSSRLDVTSGGVQIRGGTLQNFSAFTGSQTNMTGFMVYDIANAGNTFTENRDITVAGHLAKWGQGTMVLGGSNQISGAVSIGNGVLHLTDSDAISGAMTVQVSSVTMGSVNSNRSAALWLSGGITVSNRLTLMGRGVNEDGALRSLDAGNTYAGPITILGNNYVSTRIASDAGVFTLTGPITNLAGGQIAYFGGAGDMVVSGSVAGAGAFAKYGTGTLTLASSNNYTGGTYIYNGGALNLDFRSGATLKDVIQSNSGLNFAKGTLRAISASSGTSTQVFNTVTAVVGNNEIIASNTPGGAMYVRLSGGDVARNTGAGILDVSGDGTVVFGTSTTNVAGMKGSYVTVNHSDFAGQDAIGKVIPFAFYTNLVGAAPAMPNFTGAVVRVNSGSSGNITIGSATSRIHSLLVNDAAARTITMSGAGRLALSGASGASGALLLAPGAGGLTIGSVANEGGLTTYWTPNSATDLLLINNSANNLVINSPIVNNGTGAQPLTIAGIGTGQTILNATNFINGRLYVHSGDVHVNGASRFGGLSTYGGTTTVGAASTLTGNLVVDYDSVVVIDQPLTISGSNNGVQLGNAANSRSLLVINSDLWLPSGGRLQLATGTGASGAIIQNGGTFMNQNNAVVGDGSQNWAGYTIKGGEFTTTVGQEMNIGWRVAGVLDVLGGSVVASNNWLGISRGDSGIGSMGIVTVDGGYLGVATTNGGIRMNITGNARSYAQLSVVDGAVDVLSQYGNRYLDLMNTSGNTGIVNLVGGSITANQIRATGTGLSVLNLDGGTFVVPGNSRYANGTISNLSAVYVYGGGAIIDNATNATIRADLSGVFGYGLASIPVTDGGSGYIGSPVVRILGGSGTGATAVAQVDLTTGTITNILITSRGSGYLADDVLTVQMFGGGYTEAATIGAYTMTANANTGEFIKLGSAPLTIIGNSSYGGLTVVSNGTVHMANVAGTNLLSGGISGQGGTTFEQTGVGTTLIGGNSSGFGGQFNVNSGVVQFASAAAAPPGDGQLVLGPGGTIVLDAAGVQGLINIIDGSGAIALNANSANEDVNFFNADLAGTSLGAVGTVTYGGTLVPYGNYRLGGGGGTLIYTNALSGVNVIIGLQEGLAVQGVSKVQIPNAAADVNVTVQTQGVLEVSTAGATIGTLSGGTGLYGWSNAIVNGALTLGNAGDATFVGGISGTGSVTKVGSGTQVMSGNMTYTGLTTVGQGTLALVGTNAQLGGAAFVSNGAVLAASGAGGFGLMGVYTTNNNAAAGFGNYALMNRYFATNVPYGAFPTAVSNLGGNLDLGANATFQYPFPGTLTNNFAVRYTGRFIAPTNGTYWFDTASDDGSMMWIDGMMVNSNNYGQGTTMRGGYVTLAAGVHEMVVTWFNGTGGFGLYTDVAIPGGTTNRIANTMLAWGPTVGNLDGEIGSMVALSNGTLTVGQTAAGTFAGTVTSDTASVFYKSGPATLTLSGTNDNFRGTMSAVNGILKFASIDAVPANGTVNASTNGAMAFDFTGVQAALADVAATSTGTLAITATSAGDNLNFSGHQNLFLGADGAQTYTGTLTPFGGATGTNRLTGRFGTLTIATPITQGNVLIGNGSGTVVLPDGSTYTGKNIFQNGTLQIGADSGLGAVPGSANSNIVFTSNTGILRAGANGISLAASRSILVNGGMTGLVDTAGNTLTINGRIDGLNGTFTKIGNGTLSLGSATNFITSLVIGQGGFSNSTPAGLLSNMIVGTMSGGATARFATNMAIAGRLYVGFGADRAGAVIQSGGTTTVGTTLSGADVLSLGNNGGYGYYRLENGLLDVGQLAIGGNSSGGNSAVFDQFGGVVRVTQGGGWLLTGWTSSSNGVLNIWNGTMNAPPGGNNVSMGFSANINAYAMMNVLGAGAVLNTSTGSTTRAIDLMVAGGNAAGIMNINNGGRVLANMFRAGNAQGYSVLNLDGGIIIANSNLNQSAYMQGLSGAYIYDGGATIDTTNSQIGIHQALLNPIGYGITNIAITSGGAGYIGAPVIRIEGGSGTGATAVAEMDLASGTITNIYITSMGSGYLPSDSLTISLVGGGASAPAVLGAVGWNTNSPSGGLVKLGNGTLMLGGDSTYLGGTTISNGNLQIGLGGTTGSVVGAITFVNTNSWLGFNRTDVVTNGYSLVTPNGDIAAVIQNGRGGTLVMTNAAPQFKSVIVNTGSVLFASTAAIPGAGITISNSGGANRGAIVAAGAYDTASAWMSSGRIASNFAGAIALTGSTAENLNMLPLPVASIGAAQGTAVTYLGTLTPATNTYYIGGGGGELVLGLANQLVDNGRSNRNVVVGNGGGGIVRLMGGNTYNGGTLVNNGTLIVESDEALGTGPLTLIGTGFAGGTLQITNSPTYSSDRVVVFATGGGSNVLDVGAGSTAVWHGVLSSSGGGFVHKMGGGTLVLTNATLSGDASVFERLGTTIIDSGAAMYTAARYHNVGFTGGDNATLTVRGNGIFTNNADFNIADIGGTGTLNVQDSATVLGTTYYVGKSGVGTVNQSGGLIYMNGNAVVGNGGAAAGTINQTGGILSVGNLTLGATLTSLATDNLNGGVQVIRGTVLGRTIAPTNAGTAVLNINGGTLRAGNNFVISNLTSMAIGASGGTLDPSNYVMTVNQLVSGSGTLTINSASTGTVVLAFSNNFTGATAVNGGILRYNQTTALSGAGRNVSANYGGTVTLNHSNGPALMLARMAQNSVGVLGLLSNAEVAVDLRGNVMSNLFVGAVGTVGISGNMITNFGSTYRLGGGWGTLTLSNGIIRGIGTNMIAFGGGSGGALRLLGTNLLDNYQVNGGLVQFASISSMGSRVSSRPVLVNRGGSVSATGAVISTDFLGRLDTGSSGTVALIANNTAAVDFNAAGLTAMSLGAANGTWTQSGALTPAAGSYRLGGGDGILAVTNLNALTGANTLMAFGAGSGGTLVLSNTNNYTGGTWIGPTGEVRATTYGVGSGPITNTGRLVIGQTIAGTLSNVLSGTGLLIKTNTGAVVLSGNNTFTGDTLLDGGYLVLSNLAGNAVGGNVRVWSASNLLLGMSNQIPDTAILTITNMGGSDARFDMQGFNERIGGLVGQASGGNIIVEAAVDGTSGKPATLTIDTAGGNVFNYNGYLRNGVTAPASILSLVKEGAGMQTLISSQVSYSGPTVINGGTLMLSNTTGFASDVLINEGHLLLGTQTAANNRNITNNAVNGLAFGTFTNAYTIGMLSGTGNVALIGGTGGGVALTLGNLANVRGEYSGVLSDAGPGNYYMGSLIKVGNSTQVLSGANTYRGGTTISAGGLLVSSDANLGHADSPVTMNGGTLIVTNTMALSDRTMTVTAGSRISVWTNATLTLTNDIVGSQALTKDGVGMLLLDNDNSGYTGTWNVQSGIVRVAHSYALGAWGVGAVNNNLQGGPGGEGHAMELIGGITISGKVMNTSGNGYAPNTGVLRNISGTNQWLGNIVMTGGAGATTLGSDSGLLVVGGSIVPNTGGRTLTFTGAGDHLVMGGISNGLTVDMPVFKNGAGTLTLAGDNAYAGTHIQNGVLQIGDGGTTGTLGYGPVTNAGVLAFNRSNAMVVSNAILGAGQVRQMGAGVTTLTNVNTYTGMTRVMAGVLELAGPGSINNSTTIQIDAGAKMVVTGLTATMHLTSGQTLQGHGTFDGGLITDTGSFIRPGTSAGALTVNGNWQMDAGSEFTVELNGLSQGTQYDALIFGTGYALTLSNPELNVILGFAPSMGNVFSIVSGLNTGTFNGHPDFTDFQVTYGATNYTVRIDYNHISGGDVADSITLTVIPEPMAAGLVGIMGLAGWLLRRRLRGQE